MCSPDQILTAGFCSDNSSTLFLPRQQFLQRSPASSLATSHPLPRAAESLSRGAWRTECSQGSTAGSVVCGTLPEHRGIKAVHHREHTGITALLRTVLPHKEHQYPGTAVLLGIPRLSSVGICQ